MCGFLAVLQEDPVVDVRAAHAALGTIAHRGPDAAGEWREGNVYLGHRRLSIIDLATGDQPMTSADGRYVVVFNGEIYNFRELRHELAQHGATFRTKSDTEVILEGYRRWGPDVTSRLNGMFAFVVWDRVRRRALAARDRLGIKPLCWAVRNGALIVSSTLEPFHSLDKVGGLELTAVRDLMVFDYIPAPATVRKGVRKLEPGSRFEWEHGSAAPRIERYWTPPLADDRAATPETGELEMILDRAVERQMISDVPIGVFLSGGIDSSLLVALMARHHAGPVRTFSVSFDRAEADESGIARLVAERFGTDHTVLAAEDLGPDALLRLLGNLDEPFCDPALVPTYALSKLTKSHVAVALSGDGGDEVFGGYPKYLATPDGRQSLPFARFFHRSLERLPWRPRGVAHVYRRTLSPVDDLRFAMTRYGDFPVFRKDLRQVLAKPYHDCSVVSDYFAAWEQRARRYGEVFDSDVLMRADLETYLSENCLVKTDRASMLASLEVRVPFLDELVLARILPLPAERKLPNAQLKALLLPIARRLLPEAVWNRPKHGFNVPIDVRLATSWRSAVEAALDWGESHLDLFNYPYLRRLHAINLKGARIGQELWNPFVVLAWAMSHRPAV